MIPNAAMAAVAASAAALAAILVSVLVSQRQSRNRCAREMSSLRDELATHRGLCSDQIAAVRRQAEDLEASLQSTREVLRQNRFNRSTRAQAMHLLRSGMSPDTAASALGVGRREIRLLARVAEALRM